MRPRKASCFLTSLFVSDDELQKVSVTFIVVLSQY